MVQSGSVRTVVELECVIKPRWGRWQKLSSKIQCLKRVSSSDRRAVGKLMDRVVEGHRFCELRETSPTSTRFELFHVLLPLHLTSPGEVRSNSEYRKKVPGRFPEAIYALVTIVVTNRGGLDISRGQTSSLTAFWAQQPFRLQDVWYLTPRILQLTETVSKRHWAGLQAPPYGPGLAPRLFVWKVTALWWYGASRSVMMGNHWKYSWKCNLWQLRPHQYFQLPTGFTDNVRPQHNPWGCRDVVSPLLLKQYTLESVCVTTLAPRG